jgi:hypothetical protein
VSLHYSTHKDFKSHAKSSQANLSFNCELPAAFTANSLNTPQLTNTSYRLLLYRLGTDSTENTAFIVGEACLLSRFLAIEIYSCGADHLENTTTLLLTGRVCWSVYIAVAWKRSDQMRYIMHEQTKAAAHFNAYVYTMDST